MSTLSKRSALMVIAALALLLLAVAAPALARGGDYGVNTGASSSSGCGGTSQPPCTLNWSGYGLTYSHTDSDGDHVYTFDDFDCTAYGHPNGTWSARGTQCDQYQPNS